MERTACIALIIPALVIGLAIAPADAYRVRVEPRTIAAGDPFLVKVTGLDRGLRPHASVFGRTLGFVSCGTRCEVAVGATDISVRPGRYRIVVSAGRDKKGAGIKVQAHAYPVLRINLPADKVDLGEEDAERAAGEEKLLNALWQKQTEKKWEGSFMQPLPNEISTQFGVRRMINDERQSIHRGIDMRGKEGEDVRASNQGTVVLAEELFFGGNTLVLDHGMGIYSVYMHLARFFRNRGEEVARGDVIGAVGSTGRSTGPHLHFGIKVQGASVNPAAFMKLKL